MNTPLKIALLLGVALLGFFAWRNLPGLRSKVRGSIDEYGGWTQDARNEDPVGFIEYAEKKLAEDIDTFHRSLDSLTEAEQKGRVELATNEGLIGSAEELAGKFHAAFQMAELGSTYPVDVAGKSYSRQELIEQVQLILDQKSGYVSIVDGYETVLATVAEKRSELATRIQTTRATLNRLPAQKELVRIQKITGETDELLRQVDELLGGNERALTELDTPIRTVEQLLEGPPAGAQPRASGSAAALEFLEG